MTNFRIARPAALLSVVLLSVACGGTGGIVVDGTEWDGRSFPERDELLFDEDRAAPLDDDVEFVVLHVTGTRTAVEAYQVMLRDGETTHFFINPDGRTFQALDARLQANHTANWNDRSLSIHLVSPNPALAEEDPIDPSWLALGFSHAMTQNINGVPRRSLVFTDAQHVALVNLLEDIDRAYPGLARRIPMTVDGEIITQRLILSRNDGGGPFRGIVAHFHLDQREWEPGPGVHWRRIQDALDAVDTTAARD